jgi:hypothetical protein
MGKNKQQVATEARAKKSTTPEPAAVEQPTPAPATPAPAAHPATPNKQTATLDLLKAGWTERRVDLSKMKETQDGKYLNVVVAEGWPTVRIGNSGGVTVLELKSYTKAFDAAMDGLALYQKQQARESKKATATATAPAPKAAAPEAVTA